MSNFVKLYGSILDSTVWLESLPTKVVWITMLAMADADGMVAASIPGLTKRAGVTRNECEEAINILASTDTDSRTKDHEGRRIQPVPGGWLILNHRKYRDLRTETQIATAERVRKYREKQKGGGVTVTPVTSGNGEKRSVRTEAEAYTEEETTRSKTKAKATRKPSPFPKSDCDALYESWISVRGALQYSAFRKALTPLYPTRGPRFSLAELTRAIEANAEYVSGLSPKDARFETIYSFAADIDRWVRLGAMDPQLSSGELTERGRLALSGAV